MPFKNESDKYPRREALKLQLSTVDRRLGQGLIRGTWPRASFLSPKVGGRGPLGHSLLSAELYKKGM